MPFEVIKHDDYLLIHARGVCLGDERPRLSEVAIKLAEESKIRFAVVMAGECDSMTHRFLQELVAIHKAMKSVDGMVRVVAASSLIKENILQNGLDRALVCKGSLRGALIDMGLMEKKEFDVNIINPFINGTINVMRAFCQTECTPQSPFMKKSTDPFLMGEISGIVAITSEAFSGTFAISFNETVFKSLAEAALRVPCEGINPENIDFIGEIANMILGQAKVALAEQGYGVEMALPVYFWNRGEKMHDFGNGVCMVLPFQTKAGVVYSEVMSKKSVIQDMINRQAVRKAK